MPRPGRVVEPQVRQRRKARTSATAANVAARTRHSGEHGVAQIPKPNGRADSEVELEQKPKLKRLCPYDGREPWRTPCASCSAPAPRSRDPCRLTSPVPRSC